MNKKVRLNVTDDQLKRSKYSSPEAKLDWLFSALSFGKAKKRKVVKK